MSPPPQNELSGTPKTPITTFAYAGPFMGMVAHILYVDRVTPFRELAREAAAIPYIDASFFNENIDITSHTQFAIEFDEVDGVSSDL